MMDANWMTHIPKVAQISDKPKAPPHIPQPTVRSLRVGQHPMFPPKPAKVGAERPPNYMADGGVPTVTPENLPQLLPSQIPWLQAAQQTQPAQQDPVAVADQLPEPIPAGDLPPSTDPAAMDEPPEEGSLEDEFKQERRANPQMDQPTDGIGGARLPGQAPSEADNLEALYRFAPEKKEPKWWQRAIGAGVGFGSGWSNAGGKTRRPIDIGAEEQNILYPGYRSKLEQWQSKLGPQTQITNIEAAKAKRHVAQQKQNSEDAYQQSQSEMNRARGDYYRGLGRNPSVAVTPEISQASGGLYKPGQMISQQDLAKLVDLQGGRYNHTKDFVPMGANGLYDTANDRVIPGTPRQANLNPTELAMKAAQGDPAAQKALQLILNQQVQARVQSRDPAMGEMRRENQEERFSMHSNEINNQKIGVENAARNNYAAQIKAGIPEAQAQATLRSTLQGIQDNYANIIRSRGGSAQDMEVGPGLQYRARGAGAPPQQKQQSGPTDGTIIRNPRTGERKVMKGGQWQPLP